MTSHSPLSATGPEGIPTLTLADDDAEVVSVLRELQRVILVHPEASRALFRSLAKEGRLFAQTTEGAAWKSRLERSTLMQRALLVWQTSTLWMLEGNDESSTPPSAIVDALVSAASSAARETLLEDLFRETEGQC